MTWEQLARWRALRDATGTIVLEEADDDTPHGDVPHLRPRSLVA